MAGKRIRLLVFNDPYPMRINRELALEIGLDESILLLQLEYLIGISSTEVHDGNVWTYQSLRKLREDYFTFWSTAKISRILKSLEMKGLIKIGNYNKHGYDRTQWFSLNVDGIGKLQSIQLDKGVFQNEKCIRTKCKMQDDKLKDASPQDETTIPETTPENTEETTTENLPEMETDQDTDVVVSFLNSLKVKDIEKKMTDTLTEEIAQYFRDRLEKHGHEKTAGFLKWASTEAKNHTWQFAYNNDKKNDMVKKYQPVQKPQKKEATPPRLPDKMDWEIQYEKMLKEGNSTSPWNREFIKIEDPELDAKITADMMGENIV